VFLDDRARFVDGQVAIVFLGHFHGRRGRSSGYISSPIQLPFSRQSFPIGWPFAALVGAPLALDALRKVKVKFILYAVFSAIVILVPLYKRECSAGYSILLVF